MNKYNAKFLGFDADESYSLKPVLFKEIPAEQFKARWELVKEITENEVLSTLSMLFKRNVESEYMFTVNEIVENAAKYSKSDSSVTIKVDQSNTIAAFIIKNKANFENATILRGILDEIKGKIDSGYSVDQLVQEKYIELANSNEISTHMGVYMLLLNSNDPFQFEIEKIEGDVYEVTVTFFYSMVNQNELVKTNAHSISLKAETGLYTFSGTFNEDKATYTTLFETLKTSIRKTPGSVKIDFGHTSIMNSGGIFALTRFVQELLKAGKKVELLVSKDYPWQTKTFKLFDQLDDNISVTTL